jgi:hypothetical protein
MSPETKKKIYYGIAILAAGGVGIFLWKKLENNSAANSNGASAAAAEAAAQEQASQEETQLAELSELGSSGSELSSPNLGETPVEDFGQELNDVLQASGIEPIPAPSSGTGATTSTPTSTSTGSTGTIIPEPTQTNTVAPMPTPTGRPIPYEGNPLTTLIQ